MVLNAVDRDTVLDRFSDAEASVYRAVTSANSEVAQRREFAALDSCKRAGEYLKVLLAQVDEWPCTLYDERSRVGLAITHVVRALARVASVARPQWVIAEATEGIVTWAVELRNFI